MRPAFLAAAALTVSIGLAACSSGGQPSAGRSAVTTPGAPSMEVPPMSASPSPSSTANPSADTAGPFTISSSAFAAGDAVPKELTCDGANVSAPLAWSGVPAGTAALVLLVDDPDANGFVHWSVLDLPGAERSLPKGVAPSAASPQQGTNDFGQVGWGGPCPPSGTHHYRFTLTALSAPLGLGGHPNGTAVRDALAAARSKVVGTATLTATYQRA